MFKNKNIEILNLPKNQKGLIPFNEKCLFVCMEEMKNKGIDPFDYDNFKENKLTELYDPNKKNEEDVKLRNEIIKNIKTLNKKIDTNENKLSDLIEKIENLDEKINDKRISKNNVNKYKTQLKITQKQYEKAQEKSIIYDNELNIMIKNKNEIEEKMNFKRGRPMNKQLQYINYNSNWISVEQAFKKKIETFTIDLLFFDNDKLSILKNDDDLIEIIKKKINDIGPVEIYFELEMAYYKLGFKNPENDEYEYKDNNNIKKVENINDIDKCMDNMIKHMKTTFKKFDIVSADNDIIKSKLRENTEGKMEEKIEKLTGKIDSSYYYKFASSVSMKIYEKKMLNGSSYIDLPDIIKNKKCCINVKNENDNKCFMWSILSYLHQEEKPVDRKNNYIKYQNELKFDDIEFPVKIKDINKFTKQNNISVNVYSYTIKTEKEEEIMEPYIIYKCDNVLEKHVNLLYMENDDNLDEEFNSHYIWIKNFSGFLSDGNNKKFYYCFSCLQRFTSEEKLKDHMLYCNSFDAVRTVMPDDEHNIMKFDKIQNSLPMPYKVFADFECTTNKIENVNKNDNQSYTEAYQMHNISGYCMVLYCSLNNDFKIYENSGDNSFKNFMNDLNEIKSYVSEKYNYKNAAQMIYIASDEINHKSSKECYLCGEKFDYNNNNLKKVRDHCHITGNYRGAAHSLCNLKYRVPRDLPIIFHNLKGYDSHIIFNNIGEYAKKNNFEISVIPNNSEKYLSFTIKKQTIKDDQGKNIYDNLKLKFMDSYAFMASSLDTLSKNIPNEKKFTTKKYYNHLNENQFNLLTKKGVFAYDWFDDIEKLNSLSLPEQNEFYSKLNLCDISNEDFIHANKIWKEFNCKNFKDYHDLYMRTDVLLLADIWTNFENLCHEYYSLDPNYYLSLPGFALDAALKMTKVNIDLLQDPNMYMFFERGIRGGMTNVYKRLSYANNKYMNSYDKNKESVYISYLDANNLYGVAMVQKMPIGLFQWNNIENWDVEKILNYDFECDIGYTFEVDIHYPEKLHNLHNDYVMAPENIFIENEELSNYQLLTLEKNDMKRTKTKKLIGHFYDRKNYIVHGKILQFYLKQGLEITKIHKIIEYKQSAWLKEYIEFNTQKRTQAKNEFEKDFFKLLNNAVFGKTMENVRGHIDFEIITNEKRFERVVKSNKIKHVHIFNEHLVGCEKIKNRVYLNKPIFIGQSILDLSKLHMFDYYYNNIKPMYGENVKVLMTDTDSLVLEIKTNDFYMDMKKNEKLYDFSESKNIIFKDDKNKKVLGKMKCETGMIPITEFIALRPKMYSYLVENSDEKHMKAKGVRKCVTKKNISHQMYYDTLMNNKKMYHKQSTIRSEKHQIKTIEQNKISLSSFEDKRYWLNAINSMSYGYKTKQNF